MRQGLRPAPNIHISPPLVLLTTTVALLPLDSPSPQDRAADADRPIPSGAVVGGGAPLEYIAYIGLLSVCSSGRLFFWFLLVILVAHRHCCQT